MKLNYCSYPEADSFPLQNSSFQDTNLIGCAALQPHVYKIYPYRTFHSAYHSARLRSPRQSPLSRLTVDMTNDTSFFFFFHVFNFWFKSWKLIGFKRRDIDLTGSTFNRNVRIDVSQLARQPVRCAMKWVWLQGSLSAGGAKINRIFGYVTYDSNFTNKHKFQLIRPCHTFYLVRITFNVVGGNKALQKTLVPVLAYVTAAINSCSDSSLSFFLLLKFLNHKKR